MTLAVGYRHAFVSAILSRAYTKVPPAQLVTAEGPADTRIGGVDMSDGTSSHAAMCEVVR